MAKKTQQSTQQQLTIAALPEAKPQRLDKALALFLADQIPGLSRARVQKLLKTDGITCNGKPVHDASHMVRVGEVYDIVIPPPEPAEPEAQKIKLKIVCEDKDLLVIDKPAGMVVHPAPGNRDKTLVNALLAHCGKSLSGIGGVARPGIVHRLDKGTSGLMVVAKNDYAHQKLTQQFADRTLSRTYQALVWGVPEPHAGSIDAPIGRHPHDRVKMAVISKGRAALTHYKVLKIFEKTSLVECTLSTGRTHQIRVHLAHIKHPVIGDPIYGANRLKLGFSRQALHAVSIAFVHPRSGKTMRFQSVLPADMKKYVRNSGQFTKN